MNWYAYTHGDPVNGTDPTGMDDDETGEITVTAIDSYGQEVAREATAEAVSNLEQDTTTSTVDEITVIGHRQPRVANPSKYGITPANTMPEDVAQEVVVTAHRLQVAMADHTKNARPSSLGKHEKGDSRRGKDQGGEKADDNGSRYPPRQRPNGFKGPWPPKNSSPFVVVPPLPELPTIPNPIPSIPTPDLIPVPV